MTTTSPTPSTALPPRLDIEWLAQNCYIQFVHEDREYWDGSWHKEENEDEDSTLFRICEVYRRSRSDWMKFHRYMNNGKDRQTMTMCMQWCYPDYQQKRYELLGSRPTGVVAIGAIGKVEDLIMATLEKKMHATAADANDPDNDNKGRDLFYAVVALTYDQSSAVREYFHNDPSRT
jgi:hypothetical protein